MDRHKQGERERVSTIISIFLSASPGTQEGPWAMNGEKSNQYYKGGVARLDVQ
mgnify:FL=1